ncbi:hypothetical protein ACFWRV_13320 [Streptomyces sp. NPDC058576]|uniref:hypothetical protein n=1 Tax=Streptomyces sp. NPDC058576 TaxID=3346547 RepID=UPI00364AD6E2
MAREAEVAEAVVPRRPVAAVAEAEAVVAGEEVAVAVEVSVGAAAEVAPAP